MIEWSISNHFRYFHYVSVDETPDGKLFGWWMIGNNYKRVHGYHGEYPPTYLERVYSLFPGLGTVLHLFSGSVSQATHRGRANAPQQELTFDINPELQPTFCGDAEQAAQVVRAYEKRLAGKPQGQVVDFQVIPGSLQFDMILADPPYTPEDAKKYGQDKMPNATKVLKECAELLVPGGMMIWLDQKRPMYRADTWQFSGLIGVECGTNRKFRAATLLRRR